MNTTLHTGRNQRFDEAVVEKAARALWEESHWPQRARTSFRSLDYTTRRTYLDMAIEALSAAVPSLQAAAWQEGFEAGTSEELVSNPYIKETGNE